MLNSEAPVFFSVVIPCYNAESKIHIALESLLSQIYSHFETIVVLDACTDNTESVVQKFTNLFEQKSLKIQILKNPKNAGPAKCRNLGWNHASEQYVVFLDADDKFDASKLQIFSELLPKQNFPAVMGHDAYLPDTSKVNSNLITQIHFKEFLINNRIFTPCILLKTDIPERFDESMRYCEDYDLLLRLSYKYEVLFVDCALTHILRQPLTTGGLSANHLKMRLGEMRAYTKLVLLNPVFVFAVPFLLLYSSLKHIRLLIFRRLGII